MTNVGARCEVHDSELVSLRPRRRPAGGSRDGLRSARGRPGDSGSPKCHWPRRTSVLRTRRLRVRARRRRAHSATRRDLASAPTRDPAARSQSSRSVAPQPSSRSWPPPTRPMPPPMPWLLRRGFLAVEHRPHGPALSQALRRLRAGCWPIRAGGFRHQLRHERRDMRRSHWSEVAGPTRPRDLVQRRGGRRHRRLGAPSCRPRGR